MQSSPKLKQDTIKKKLQKNVTPIIDTTCITVKDIKNNIYAAQKELKKILNTLKLRKQYLLQRASAHDIHNNKTSPKSIINILKIESTIKMWKRINSITNNSTTASLNILDIPKDTTIHRNNIKKSYRLAV